MFQQSLGTFTMLLAAGFSEIGYFRNLSDYVFGIRNFGNTKSMRVIFVSKCSKFNRDLKNFKKSEKKFFVSEIITSELISLNCLY